MASLYEMLFGNLPPPRHPGDPMSAVPSRYAAMPTSQNIENRVFEPEGDWVKKHPSKPPPLAEPYPQTPLPGQPGAIPGQWPSVMGGGNPSNPLSNAGDIAWAQGSFDATSPTGAYAPSTGAPYKPYYPSGPHPAPTTPPVVPGYSWPGRPDWKPPDPNAPPGTYGTGIPQGAKGMTLNSLPPQLQYLLGGQ
jgi:hypothetical protein